MDFVELPPTNCLIFNVVVLLQFKLVLSAITRKRVSVSFRSGNTQTALTLLVIMKTPNFKGTDSSGYDKIFPNPKENKMKLC